MGMRLRTAGLVLGGMALWQLAGCSSTRQYRCPDPIGVIVRDDCEVYRTRYEATRVDLAAGVSKFKVEGSISQQALRDPSQLIQVMSARMVALCHDFNACRITPQQYSQRRAEIDKTMTAIAAISEQLQQPGLKPAERRRLLDRLMQLLSVPAPATPPNRQPSAAAPPPRKRRRYLSRSQPWLGSRFLPPLPPVAEGFPRLLPQWSARSLGHVWVPRSPDKPAFKKIGGWILGKCVTLAGRLEADDRLEIRFADGRRLGCPVGRNHEEGGRVCCRPPKEFHLNGSHLEAEYFYRRAATGQTARLGKIERRVVENVEHSYCLDHDSEVSEGWLHFQPEPPELPADYERPYLRVTLRLRRYRPATVRCFADGQAVTGAIRAGRGSGQTGTCQDLPRYYKTDEHTSVARSHPFVRWQHYEFALPFLAPAGKGAPLPKGFTTWPPRAGQWRCLVKVEATPVRELRFQVKADGKLQPVPGQRGRPGDLNSPWWRVDTRILPNDVEFLDHLGDFPALVKGGTS